MKPGFRLLTTAQQRRSSRPTVATTERILLICFKITETPHRLLSSKSKIHSRKNTSSMYKKATQRSPDHIALPKPGFRANEEIHVSLTFENPPSLVTIGQKSPEAPTPNSEIFNGRISTTDQDGNAIEILIKSKDQAGSQNIITINLVDSFNDNSLSKYEIISMA